MEGQPGKWGWYGELPPSVLVAAIIRRALPGVLAPGGVAIHPTFQRCEQPDQEIPTRTVVGVLVLSGAINILRQPRWAKGPPRVEADEDSAPTDTGL